jgi:hypothetical protein
MMRTSQVFTGAIVKERVSFRVRVSEPAKKRRERA